MDIYKLTIRSLAVFASVLALGGATTAVAAILTVGNATSLPCTGTFPTIQSAITVANPGDTIQVCQGTYNESVQINKTLTLLGAQANVDARTRATTNESIINAACSPVQITADNVVLNGFTVQGSTQSDPCTISGIWMNPGSNAADVGGAQILNNIVQNNISGIELDSLAGASPTLVQYNLIQNNNNSGPGSGNAIQTNFGLIDATIDSNKFVGHTSSSVLIVTASSGITASNNELVSGANERILFGAVSTGSITGNTSIGSTAVNGPIRLFGGNSNINIDRNVVRNGVRGIKVDDVGFGPNSGVSGHLNCITGNSVAGLEVATGAYSGGPGTLDADNNWWGSASGPMIASNPPGTGDKIIDPDGVVDYTPFLVSDATTPCASPTQVSQITVNDAKCKQFSSGTAKIITAETYTVNGHGLINGVAPDKFAYWVKVTAPAGSNTFTITETITTGNFNRTFALDGGNHVFRASNCTDVHGASFSQNTTTGTTSAVTVNFNAPSAGTYYINIVFQTGNVKNAGAPTPSTVHYNFSTTGVSGSTSGLDLKKKGT